MRVTYFCCFGGFYRLFFARGAPRGLTFGSARGRPYALIIVVARDDSGHAELLKRARFRGRNWEIAALALYHGANHRFKCQECRAVWRAIGLGTDS